MPFLNKDVRKLFFTVVTISLVLIVCAAVLFVFGNRVIVASDRVARDHEVIRTVDDALSTMKDAETGQRGFLLTGEAPYLDPYRRATAHIQEDLVNLDRCVATGDLPGEKVAEFKALVKGKLDELALVLDTDRSSGRSAALAVVRDGQGKQWMDRIRTTGEELKADANEVMQSNQQYSRYITALRTGLFVACTVIELVFLCWAAWRIKLEMEQVAASAETIREQGDLYATTLASIGDAVITTDEKGAITFMNAVAVNLTGWSPAETDGQPLSKVFRIINESTRLPVENPVDKVLRLGTIVGLANHTLLIRKDESEVPIDDSGAPIRHSNGTIRGVVLVFRDFSEHKRTEAAIRQSEEQVRLAIDGAELGTFYCDMPLDKIVWNERCKMHFWLPADADVDFTRFYSLLHADDREPTRGAIEKALRDHTAYDVEYRTVSSAGQIRWVRAVGRFYYDEAGQPTRFDGITMDISDRKQREQMIQEARGQAEAANKAKDQFLATLSHELRTPLTPVLATLGMWDKLTEAPHGFAEDVQMIRRNIELEARLIDDLLDLTRVVKGKLVVSLQKLDVHELLKHVVTVCGEDVLSKKIVLNLKLNAEHHHVKADAGRLQQVMWNILRNAVKFSPRQSGIDVTTSNGPDGSLRITMSDSGIGMSAETINRLFKPFEQGNDEITRRFGGLGLGLAISKALLDAQGGTIEARSEGLGKGSEFAIKLPALTANEAAAMTPEKSDAPTSHARQLDILLVEDHVDTARILKLVMSSWGHDVQTASSVAMGISMAQENKFDLVISDIGLPDGTGLDLIRQIRKFSQVPAIALTGYGMDDDITATQQAGFNAHLTKPTDLQQLQASIGKFSVTGAAEKS